MAIETTSLRRNLSRFELAVTILIIAVLFAAFMSRMSGVEGAAERSILQARYQDMQARLLTLKVQFVSGTGGPLTLEDVVRHLGRGDIAMLSSRDDPGWTDVRPGGWAWWAKERTIAYRVINEEYFADAGIAPVVRFKLEPRYVDMQDDGRYDPARDRLTGATLSVVDVQALSAGGSE